MFEAEHLLTHDDDVGRNSKSNTTDAESACAFNLSVTRVVGGGERTLSRLAQTCRNLLNQADEHYLRCYM